MDINELKILIKNGKFKNPTKGELSLNDIIQELIDYRNENVEARYKIFIGTDSEEREKGVDFVSVIAIHRIGKGGRYFWLRNYDKQKLELRNRIFKEATISLALAYALLEQELESNNIPIAAGKSVIEAIKELEQDPVNNFKSLVLSKEFEIHVDIGNNGPTSVMIKEIVGMIRGSGFFVKIKPEAFAAANVADKHL